MPGGDKGGLLNNLLNLGSLLSPKEEFNTFVDSLKGDLTRHAESISRYPTFDDRAGGVGAFRQTEAYDPSETLFREPTQPTELTPPNALLGLMTAATLPGFIKKGGAKGVAKGGQALAKLKREGEEAAAAITALNTKGAKFYHAGRANLGLELKEGKAFHVGTREAAIDRIQRPSNQGATNRGIHEFEVNPKKPYMPGGKVLDERNGRDRTKLFTIQNVKQERERLVEEGFDAIPYINAIEGEGSISWMILNPKAVRFTGKVEKGRVGSSGKWELEPAPTPRAAKGVGGVTDEAAEAAAQTQRGKPETVMIQITARPREGERIPAVISDLLEHVGDLSNRAQQRSGIALVNVDEKLRKLEGFSSSSRITLKKELELGLRGNAEYKVFQRDPDFVRLESLNDQLIGSAPEVSAPIKAQLEAEGITRRSDIWDKMRERYAGEVERELARSREAIKRPLAEYKQAHLSDNQPVTEMGQVGKEMAISLADLDFDELGRLAKKMRGLLDEIGSVPRAEREALRLRPAPTQ